MILTEGTILKSRYEIHKKLAAGGFGNVYLAEDKLKGGLLAIKETLYEDFSEGDVNKLKEQFRFEAEILVHLSHPRLPRVEDFFEEGNKYYLVMEYIDGEDLQKIIDENSSIPLSQILDWSIQLCNVMEYLHSQKPAPVIFRDLKPKNIMLSRKGEIKLIDFGISKLFDSRDTKSAARAASQYYAPPEQYTSSGTDTLSDVYSLGATFYFLFTHYHPVDAIDRLTDTLTLNKPSALNEAITPELDNIILKAMDLNKNKRFKSVSHLREALEKIAPSYGELPDTIELCGKLIDNTAAEKIDNFKIQPSGSLYRSSTASREIIEKERTAKGKILCALISLAALILVIFILRPFIAGYAMDQAKLFYKTGDYGKAINFLKGSQFLGNSGTEVAFALGQCYLCNSDYDKSIEEFEKIKFAFDAHYWLCKAYILRDKKDDYEKIISELESYLKDVPGDYRAWLDLGNSFLDCKGKNIENDSESLNKALNCYLKSRETLYFYDYTSQREYYIWQKDRNKISYLLDIEFGIGRVYQLLGDYEMALRQYESIKKINPLYSKLENEISSIIEKINKSDDYSVTSGVILGDAYLLLGKFNEALEEYKNALKKDKSFNNNAYFLMHMGQASLAASNTKGAINYFKSALDIISQNPDKYKDLTIVIPGMESVSMSYISPGESSKQDRSLPSNNDKNEKIYLKELYSSSGTLSVVSPEEKILPQSNGGSELYYYMAEAYETEKNFPEAIKNYETYIELCPRGVFSLAARDNISRLEKKQ